jgi:hypothetical protein
MCGEQPLHPAAVVAIGMRPDHEVKVVGYQAVSEYVHEDPGRSVGDGLDEGM